MASHLFFFAASMIPSCVVVGLLTKPAYSTPAATAAFLQQAKEIWREMAPEKPFSYNFLDESLAELSAKETAMGRGIMFFTARALFIACLGLFGLATFLTGQRSKEIGIRKVLGASITSVIGLLSRDFLLLVLIAAVVATPLAYYAMHRWLQDFQYQTPLSWWLFALTIGMAMAVALFTVGLRTLSAARANPVESLKNE